MIYDYDYDWTEIRLRLQHDCNYNCGIEGGNSIPDCNCDCDWIGLDCNHHLGDGVDNGSSKCSIYNCTIKT